MTPSPFLRPLLNPASVALVGASSRPGSIGRIVMENLLEGDFRGTLFAVNPSHRRVLGQRSYPSLSAIGSPIDLALIAVPCLAVRDVLDQGASVGAKTAVVFSAPPESPGDARRWQKEILAVASERGIRLIGPDSYGVIRTSVGLNATVGTGAARQGRLALIAQSGAVCAAMLAFAATTGIGFSTVVALGDGIDVGFGELLDSALSDPETDGILVYAETLGDARRFLSALRAAARTKPVVVLKAGRSTEQVAVGEPVPDAVFDAAMHRTGAVRARTYVQLFAAARILAMKRMARGDRLAIVTNGHGPATLAADVAADRRIPLAELSRATERALGAALPPSIACANPLNLRAEGTPQRMAAALEAVLADPEVDAVLALHVDRPLTAATDTARAVAAVAHSSAKPVLAAWLGSVDRPEVDAALEAGGVANFYSPENAVDAFSFLSAYRRNQEWLLEVPSPQPEPHPPDLRAVDRIRTDATSTRRSVLTGSEANALLAAFGLPVPSAIAADTLNEALAAARRLGYPVALASDAPGARAPTNEQSLVQPLRNGRMLTRAWAKLIGGEARTRRRAPVIVRRARPFESFTDVGIGVHVDAVFGSVITLGAPAIAGVAHGARVVLLPPLNERLARDLVQADRSAFARNLDGSEASIEILTRLLVQVSGLVCALPWLRCAILDPVRIGDGRAEILGGHVAIDLRPKAGDRPYAHMAIHPYPIEQVADVKLADGTTLHLRPIRPEDAELERAFVHGLSEQSRYFRFFYQIHELTPAMLARFTQVDYDRETALVAVDESAAGRSIVGVARYIVIADRESAEFAVVVADAWQGRGVARLLMMRLVGCAKARGLKRLEGAVLRSNSRMVKFMADFGSTMRDDPDDPEQVIVTIGVR
ncbi:MAG TPA: GNAT family N-acetyltransferase [Casimicrobiaceae bacterium]|nr:GNAT family N-acetyltransferase [Casimicrobiaceae bacterium]